MVETNDAAKPIKRHHVFAYDYDECRKYLETRDGYDEHDYAGTFAGHPEAPYQNFWHFVTDKVPDIQNDSCFVMEEAWKEDAELWQQEILMKYLEAFGERSDHPPHERSIQFYVSW